MFEKDQVEASSYKIVLDEMMDSFKVKKCNQRTVNLKFLVRRSVLSFTIVSPTIARNTIFLYIKTMDMQNRAHRLYKIPSPAGAFWKSEIF